MSADARLETGRTVAILGLGLIGGSLARDLAGQGIRVIGYDRDDGALRSAVDAGVLAGAIDAQFQRVREADVVIVATPVDQAHGVLQRLTAISSGARLIMDVGSTKSDILATATAQGLGERFVGSHPLAGDHQSGWRASRVGLFVGARVFVCPAPQALGDPLALAMAFWTSLGALPEHIEAREHDDHLAWSSHLPHVVSSALATTLRRAGIRRSDLGPGGRDVTRLAGSSADVWTPIVRENATAIAAALASVEDELRTIRRLLFASDSTKLAGQFAVARAWFEDTDENAVAGKNVTEGERSRPAGATPEVV
jgi:prephenate dehydrogenase